MPESAQAFLTLSDSSGPFTLKERGSKFLGYAFPVSTVETAEKHIADLWEQHPGATHVCYAYLIGRQRPRVRTQDDGEPANSAGPPILGQIQAKNLSDVLVAVVRYYGGTKLGVGGLIQAYREAAAGCLEVAPVITKVPHERAVLQFGYDQLSATLRAIDKHQLQVVSRELTLACRLVLGYPVKERKEVREIFQALPGVSFKLQ